MSTPARVAGLRLKDACTSSLKTRWYSSDAVKRYDEEKYGGWKSADILFAEKEVHRTVIGRWDWHAWQLLIGLLPAAVVAGIAYWARKDMEKVFGATLTYKRPAREDRHAAGAAQPRPDMPTGPVSVSCFPELALQCLVIGHRPRACTRLSLDCAVIVFDPTSTPD
ncbi:hypothetical protein ACKKBF_B12665 [Auxenochlorella protothecoides x Auxenochlorella symbiontica]